MQLAAQLKHIQRRPQASLAGLFSCTDGAFIKCRRQNLEQAHVDADGVWREVAPRVRVHARAQRLRQPQQPARQRVEHAARGEVLVEECVVVRVAREHGGLVVTVLRPSAMRFLVLKLRAAASML